MFASPDKALRSRIVAFCAATVILLLQPSAGHAAKKKKDQQDPAGSLAGTVMSEAEEVLQGVEVVVQGTGEVVYESATTTDKEGKFKVEIPSAGDFVLRLDKKGYTPFETSLVFGPGEAQDIQVKMLDAVAGRRNEAVRAYNAGAKAYEARDLATAKKHFLAAVAADPTLAEPYLVLADIHLVDGEPQAAAVVAEKYLELSPGDKKATALAYEAYQKLGNQAKVDELRGALSGDAKLKPMLAIQVYNEGALANQAGDLETAAAKFQAALDLDPNLVAAHAALAALYYNQKHFDQALAAVNKALALAPDDKTSRRVSFLLHDARGDQAAADAAMAAYLKLDAEGAAALLYQRADLDFRDGEPELARAGLLKVLEIQPDMARAHYTLGLIYSSTDAAKARQHLEKFLALAPEDPEADAAKEILSYL